MRVCVSVCGGDRVHAPFRDSILTPVFVTHLWTDCSLTRNEDECQFDGLNLGSGDDSTRTSHSVVFFLRFPTQTNDDTGSAVVVVTAAVVAIVVTVVRINGSRGAV